MNIENPPRAIALGYFDGVHRGHMALMERAVLRAAGNRGHFFGVYL